MCIRDSTYTDLTADPARLQQVLSQLVPFHGSVRVAGWQDLARRGAFETLAAELVAQHYDRRYAKSRAARTAPTLLDVSLEDLSDAALETAAAAVLNALSSRPKADAENATHTGLPQV